MNLIKKLPDPFLMNDGSRVETAVGWKTRRTEITKLLLDIQYGNMPEAPEVVSWSLGNWNLLDKGRKQRRDFLEFKPSKEKPRTVFSLEIKITYPSEASIARKNLNCPEFGKDGIPAVVYVGEKLHGSVLDNGYAIINYPNDTLEPMEMGKPRLGPAREAYQILYGKEYQWGSISAWAWGARRVLDHIIRMPEINRNHIAISGHSRNGKAALLAGALDERFAVVNPAGSGCAGAGSYLALGNKCEDLAALTSRERWWAWAHPEFGYWAGRESELPFDQHFLMSLVAPRPLLRTEGIDDDWANPEGTSASYLATKPIYEFMNVSDRNAIFYREGGHEHTEEDGAALMVLCDETFFDQERLVDLSKHLPQTPSRDNLFDWDVPGT
ncbi:MAG: hypothetical protein VX910_01510 [Candidatus Latescibacterota bacterium]|nr:hypothetical protein [Candidatus Latescibacterota bacterium]